MNVAPGSCYSLSDGLSTGIGARVAGSVAVGQTGRFGGKYFHLSRLTDS
jgi:hypothetical protein